MKTIKFLASAILLVFVLGTSVTSCAVSKQEQTEAKMAGYTLKNKKELMQQKIALKRGKKVLATP